MIWIRGVNVFPSAIEAGVRGFEELGDEFEIIVEGRRTLPVLRIRAERSPHVSADTISGLQDAVRDAVTTAIRATAEVEILPYGTLPRADARRKRRRLIDQRRDTA